MRLFLSALIILASMSSSVMAQTSPDKKALILKFLDISGTRSSLSENLDMMIKQIPPDQAQDAADVRTRVKVDEIIDQLVPIYDRNFTDEQLQGLIDFYSSPLGRTFISKLPDVMRESVEVSTKYMESKFPESAPAAATTDVTTNSAQ